LINIKINIFRVVTDAGLYSTMSATKNALHHLIKARVNRRVSLTINVTG